MITLLLLMMLIANEEARCYYDDSVICFHRSRHDKSPHGCSEFPAWRRKITRLTSTLRGSFNNNAATGEI